MPHKQQAEKVENTKRNPSEEVQQDQQQENAIYVPLQFQNLQASSSPHSVMQLQRMVGNRATIQLLRQGSMSNSGAMTIQRWPKWLDKLLGKSEEAKPLLSDSESSDLDVDSGPSKQQKDLEKVKEILQSWADKYAIHTNYQKYAKYLGNTAWKKVMQVWEYVNKVLGTLANLDPSGIATAVSAVSKLIKKLAQYVTEAYDLVTDNDLIEQLTPLISVSIVDAVKASIEEIKDVWETGKSAWEAVTDLI